jgi:predicted extracellular nuclease
VAAAGGHCGKQGEGGFVDRFSFRAVLGAAFAVVLVVSAPAGADTTPQVQPFSQDWTNTGLITTNDNWSGVAGITGYRGDGLTSANDVDPQTVLAPFSGSPIVDVNANQTNPDTFTTGGVTEFHVANPTVALTGSGTADAPSIVLFLNTTGKANINIAYNLRDIDGSTDNAAQQVALQYRVGSSGNYTNVPAGYVADATTGPSLATQVTPVAATLPAPADNQPLVEVRIITTNATGNDEWVGVDDIAATADDLPPEVAPQVSTTTPANGAGDVAVGSNISITFSEPVTVTGSWYTISCSLSGTPSAAVSGGPTTYTLDPAADLQQDESCTVTVDDVLVTDNDTDDPPDTMAADYVFSFQTEGIPARIYEIQGAGHTSPLAGRGVVDVPGIVTALRLAPASARGFYLQDPSPDVDDATSEGIFVFTSPAVPSVAVGDAVTVNGTVSEFRPGGDPDNLTITELTAPNITVVTSGNPPPAATIVGAGGRTAPTEVIEDDAGGNVETGGVFDPATDGIDFYESLESMLVQVNAAAVVGATRSFGEITVLPDSGAWATGLRTPRGGILYSYADPNPERVIVDDEILRDQIVPRPLGKAMPDMNVGDDVTSPIVGPLDYSFSNFKIQATTMPVFVSGGIRREVAGLPDKSKELAIATFNVENLNPGNPAAKFADLAELIVDNLRAPDILAIEEIQDNDGTTNNGVTDASQTYAMLIAAIRSAGGPTYAYRQIDPVNNADGGVPGGNIRVALLFRTDLKHLSFVDRPGGSSTTDTQVVGTVNHPQLSASPGRLGTSSPAFLDTRKPLVGEFKVHGRTLFVVVNHFSSKNDDQPLNGPNQPPTRFTEVPRHGQAQVVNDFVDEVLALDKKANVVVLGDINDFEFSTTVDILTAGGVLTTLVDTLPSNERYSYVFEGNSQVLDQILVSGAILSRGPAYDVVHVNSEFADAIQASDHEPSVAHVRAH